MRLFWFLLRSSWSLVALAVGMGLLSGGSSAALIALISHAVSGSSTAAMITVPASFVGLVLIAAITSFLAQVVLIRLSQNAVFHLRMRLSQQILSSELSHLEQVGTPRLLATLTDDVQSVMTAVYALPFVCIDLAIVAGCLGYLLWLYWSVFLCLLVFMAVALGSSQVLLKRGRRYMALVREDQDRLYQHFHTLTEGTKELKLNYSRQQDFVTRELQVTANTFRRHNVRSLLMFAFSSSWGQLLLFFAIGLVLFALPHLLQLPPQVTAGYILTFTYLLMPMDNLVNSLPQLSRASVALDKIESLGLALDQRAEGTAPPAQMPVTWQNLELRGVTHTYSGDQEDSRFVLGPINLVLNAQQIIFIVGGNGSGKSTLAKLITGLYAPDQGEILLDGLPITAANRESYRQYFSAIFADFYLFDRLIGMNRPDLDDQARFYLKQLQLDHKVTIENGKLSTTFLSQGQRKRLALLAAYLEDRSIYLFDEWAADQDPTFKELFYTRFLPDLKQRGKTLLVISHDDRYFHLADRLIKLDYGQIEYDKR